MLTHPMTCELAAGRREALLDQAAHARLVRAARRTSTKPTRRRIGFRWRRPLTAQPVNS